MWGEKITFRVKRWQLFKTGKRFEITNCDTSLQRLFFFLVAVMYKNIILCGFFPNHFHLIFLQVFGGGGSPTSPQYCDNYRCDISCSCHIVTFRDRYIPHQHNTLKGV